MRGEENRRTTVCLLFAAALDSRGTEVSLPKLAPNDRRQIAGFVCTDPCIQGEITLQSMMEL
jgi:hypothetical protein